MKLRQQMEESQSAEKLGAPSWLVYEILLYSSHFICTLLAFYFTLVFSNIFQEPNTQKSLHNTADKDVTNIRKVWWLWNISDYFLRFIFIFICQNSEKKEFLMNLTLSLSTIVECPRIAISTKGSHIRILVFDIISHTLQLMVTIFWWASFHSYFCFFYSFVAWLLYWLVFLFCLWLLMQ